MNVKLMSVLAQKCRQIAHLCIKPTWKGTTGLRRFDGIMRVAQPRGLREQLAVSGQLKGGKDEKIAAHDSLVSRRSVVGPGGKDLLTRGGGPVCPVIVNKGSELENASVILL